MPRAAPMVRAAARNSSTRSALAAASAAKAITASTPVVVRLASTRYHLRTAAEARPGAATSCPSMRAICTSGSNSPAKAIGPAQRDIEKGQHQIGPGQKPRQIRRHPGRQKRPEVPMAMEDALL